MVKDLCYDCQSIFEHKGRAYFCPKCVKRRISEAAKKRNLNRLGLIAQGKKVEDSNESD